MGPKATAIKAAPNIARVKLNKVIAMGVNSMMPPIKIVPFPIAERLIETGTKADQGVICRTVTRPGVIIERRRHLPGPIHAPWVIGGNVNFRHRGSNGHKASVVHDNLLRGGVQRAGAFCAASHALNRLHNSSTVRDERVPK